MKMSVPYKIVRGIQWIFSLQYVWFAATVWIYCNYYWLNVCVSVQVNMLLVGLSQWLCWTVACQWVWRPLHPKECLDASPTTEQKKIRDVFHYELLTGVWLLSYTKMWEENNIYVGSCIITLSQLYVTYYSILDKNIWELLVYHPKMKYTIPWFFIVCWVWM